MRSFTMEDGLPGGGTCQLALAKDGQLWFGRGKWLGVYQDDRFRPSVELASQRIIAARAGGLWICTRSRRDPSGTWSSASVDLRRRTLANLKFLETA